MKKLISLIIIIALLLIPSFVRAESNKYAVVWGSSGYKGEQICGDNNARLMAHLLIKEYSLGRENIRTSIGRLTTQELLGDLDWLRQNTDEDSTVFIFYSGHGTMNGVGKFSHYYFNYLLQDIKYAELCLVFECCYSGNAVNPLSGENRLVIASTAVNHTGYTTTHSSIFGHYFLNEAIKRGLGDANSDGQVSMQEAFYYYHNKNPYLYGTISDNCGEFFL